EPDSGRIQSLPEVQGKGKEKLIDEHVAHTLLDLNTPKKKSVADHETESDEIVTPVNKEKDASNRGLTEINAGVQDEGHAGSNPVDWAMQAPLRARFSNLPAVDMKEILQQRMFEDNSYKAHDDHKNLFEALQKSLKRDYSNQLLADLDEARMKKRK
nr:hypothetical protein [Tanacetum cinerariifolium]